MIKKIDHVIGLCFLSMLLLVNVAAAQSTTVVNNTIPVFNSADTLIPSLSTESAAMEKDPGYIDRQTKLSVVISNGVRIIDIRVNDLNALKKKVNASKLSAEQKSPLVASIEAQIGSLQALSAKIKADTDIRIAKADVKSVYTTFRTYGVFMPKIRLTMSVELLLNHSEKIFTVITQTQARIDQDGAKCLNVTARQKALDDANILSDGVIPYPEELLNTINSLSPENYSASSTTIINNANKAIKEARTKFSNIRSLLYKANARSYSTCSRSQTCNAGTCTAKPVCDNKCKSGQTGCSVGTGISSNVNWTCAKDSAGCFYKKESSCPLGNICSNGKCVATPGTVTCTNQCTPGEVGTCTNTYMASNCEKGDNGCYVKTEKSCASSEPCYQGNCTISR